MINEISSGMLGCSPTGPDDAACFKSFVERFGKQAFRRSLTTDEVSAFTKFQSFSIEANDFMAGIRFAVLAFLQMPDFLYVLETGIALETRPEIRRLSYLTGVPWDLHEVGHASGDTAKVADCIAWHTKHWARLVQKFADTEEAGKSMLDNSAILYLCEGGKGYVPQGDKGQSTHSTENMCMLVAGRAGGLNAGVHIDGQKNHPAKALISCMKAVGVQTDTLGEVTGELPGLRTV